MTINKTPGRKAFANTSVSSLAEFRSQLRVLYDLQNIVGYRLYITGPHKNAIDPIIYYLGSATDIGCNNGKSDTHSFNQHLTESFGKRWLNKNVHRIKACRHIVTPA